VFNYTPGEKLCQEKCFICYRLGGVNKTIIETMSFRCARWL